MWATPEGVRTLDVTNDPDENGNRGTIGLFGQQKLLLWFREAESSGDTVDAGIDVRNATMRIRRRSPATVTAGSLSAFLPSSRRVFDDLEDAPPGGIPPIPLPNVPIQ